MWKGRLGRNLSCRGYHSFSRMSREKNDDNDDDGDGGLPI